MASDALLKSFQNRFKRDRQAFSATSPNSGAPSTGGHVVPSRLRVKANDEGAAMSGYLHQRTGGGKWKKVWFVLKDKVLYIYKASEDTIANESSPILGFDLDFEVEVSSKFPMGLWVCSCIKFCDLS
jgi:hypothetical protein